MSTKALFVAAMGGPGLPMGIVTPFVRSSGDILTATAHGFETGAGPFRALNSAEDAPAGITASKHSETFGTALNVVPTDTFEANGKTYTIIASPAADGDVDDGVTDDDTIANIAAAINQDVQASPTTYDEATVANPEIKAIITAAGVITIQAKTLEAAVGDAITCSSTGGTITVDNATLQGGVDGDQLFIIRLTDDTFSFAASKDDALAGTAVTLTDAGTGVNSLISTVQTFSDQLEDVVVNVLTANGSRSVPSAFNTAKFWRAAIDGVGADSL